MKTRVLPLLAFIVLGFGSLWLSAEQENGAPVQDSQAPPGNSREANDPFADSDSPSGPPQMVQVQVEFVELPHETLTKLLFLRSPKKADATELRKQVQELVTKNEAKVLETQILVSRSGGKATGESIHEFIYPSEYEAFCAVLNGTETDKFPNAIKPPDNPAIPTSFETRNVGSTLEIEPTIGEDNRMMDLRFVPEFLWHTGNTVWYEGKDSSGNPFKVQEPDFYCVRMNTSITCIDGQNTFVGALSPKDSKGVLDTTRKLMIFVKCDILTVE